MKKNNVEVNLKDLYQFLISECRYGYTRNNHLMPGGAYGHVKEYLPKIAEQDKDHAIYVAKQLCEECISYQLINNFYDGYDDEFGNRKEALKFIDWCFNYVNATEDWSPYNYNQFIENCKKDDEPRYNIYRGKESIPLNTIPVSEHELLDSLVSYITSDDKAQVTYQKEKLNDSTVTYHILHPIKEDFTVLDINRLENQVSSM